MTYLKHNNGSKGKQQKAAKKSASVARVVVTGPDAPCYEPTPSMQHDINHVAGMDGVEASLDWIAKGLARLTSDDHTVNLTLAQGSNIYPLKLTLAENDFDDTMARIVTAFERIADSLARLAGLSRPRLELWHEQCEYTPLFRESACDGGEPGPPAEDKPVSTPGGGSNLGA